MREERRCRRDYAGRLYLRAGNGDRAEDHLLIATRLFIAMDMPLWLAQAALSLSKLGRLLIGSREQQSLYEYLNRALAPADPIRVIVDPYGTGPRIDSEGAGSTSRACCDRAG